MIITSDYEQSGRFGIALSKIGDINMDGYNDIAISAPFEGNGVVYIYLGGSMGLSSKPSQILQAPTSDGSTMFGHSISRGVDIDNNNYNDVAIGAPNSDTVYVYKSYPVIKMVTSLNNPNGQLLPNVREFSINVCAKYISPGSISNKIGMSSMISQFVIDSLLITLLLDIKFHLSAEQRHKTSFDKHKIVVSFEKDFKVNSAEDCFDFQMYYNCSTANIYLPIEIRMTYHLVHELPKDSNVFCETCVIEDPNNSKMSSLKIPFSTGCKSVICVSDLTLTGSFVDIGKTYILGSTKTIAILYNVTNSGETAYLVELTIDIPSNVKLSQTPSNCNVNKEQTSMKCDVNVGKQLENDGKVNFTATFDVSLLNGKVFEVNAFVNGSGKELKPADNHLQLKLNLEEFSVIDLKG